MDELVQLFDQESFPHRKLAESCRYFYSDGFSATLPVGKNALIDVLVNNFGESPKTVYRYLEKMKKGIADAGQRFAGSPATTVEIVDQSSGEVMATITP